MALMHRETFDIIDGTNIDEELDEYFEVDEYIALPIQILNRKGYRTKFCCQGHPYPSRVKSTFLNETEEPKDAMPGILSITKTGETQYDVIARQHISNRSYRNRYSYSNRYSNRK